MRRRRLGRVLTAAAGVAVTASMLGTPAVAAGPDGGGAEVEEFVCYRSNGDKVELGTGKAITTPSGESRFVCTGEPVR